MTLYSELDFVQIRLFKWMILKFIYNCLSGSTFIGWFAFCRSNFETGVLWEKLQIREIHPLGK